MSYTSKQIHHLNNKSAGVVGCLLVVFFLYILLLSNDGTIFSLHEIYLKTKVLCGDEQFLVFLLLPIYFAVMIFGGGAIGWFVGSKTYQVVSEKLYTLHS